jgi:hypothetical protein
MIAEVMIAGATIARRRFSALVAIVDNQAGRKVF